MQFHLEVSAFLRRAAARSARDDNARFASDFTAVPWDEGAELLARDYYDCCKG